MNKKKTLKKKSLMKIESIKSFDKTIKIKSVLNNTEGISVVSKCEKIIKYKLES